MPTPVCHRSWVACALPLPGSLPSLSSAGSSGLSGFAALFLLRGTPFPVLVRLTAFRLHPDASSAKQPSQPRRSPPAHLPGARLWPRSVPWAPMVKTAWVLGSASPGGPGQLHSGGSKGLPKERLRMTLPSRGLTGAEPESTGWWTRWGDNRKAWKFQGGATRVWVQLVH